MPISGATAACQAARGRAGASIAGKPASSAPVPIAPLLGLSSPSSRISASPTGTAMRKPRRSAGPGLLGPIAKSGEACSRRRAPLALNSSTACSLAADAAGAQAPVVSARHAPAQVAWRVVILAALSSDPAAGIGIFAALAAGVVSFLSPCVLPLVPGYLSAVSGVSASELETAGWRRILAPSLLFVASFSTIFVAEGLTATALGSAFQDHEELL